MSQRRTNFLSNCLKVAGSVNHILPVINDKYSDMHFPMKKKMHWLMASYTRQTGIKNIHTVHVCRHLYKESFCTITHTHSVTVVAAGRFVSRNGTACSALLHRNFSNIQLLHF